MNSSKKLILTHVLTVIAGIFLQRYFVPNPELKRSFMNQYFVKYALLWTCPLVFIYLSLDSLLSGTLSRIYQFLAYILSIVVVWRMTTAFFTYAGTKLGTCGSIPGIHSPTSCDIKGGKYNPLDISGHSFILIFCELLIANAKQKSTYYYQDNSFGFTDWKFSVHVLYLMLTYLQILWFSMFTMTAIYFHSWLEKVLGLSFGVFGYVCVKQLSGF